MDSLNVEVDDRAGRVVGEDDDEPHASTDVEKPSLHPLENTLDEEARCEPQHDGQRNLNARRIRLRQS